MKNNTSSINRTSSLVDSHSSIVDSLHFEAKYPPDSRFSEIEKMFSLIKLGKSIELIGLPGVGRSNLLGLLSFNRNVRIAHVGKDEQTKYHFVLINFSEIKEKPLSEINKFIFLSLVDSLRLRNILNNPKAKKELETVSSIFRNSVDSNDDMVIFNALKRTIDFLCNENDLSIIFLFDRFEEYVKNVSEEFFINLRALRDRAKYKFSVIFSLKRSAEDILEPEIYESFYEFFQNNTIYLPTKDKPGLEFRIKYLEENLKKKFDPKIISEIEKLTLGHGKLTRIGLEQIAQGSTIDNLLSTNSVKSVLLEIWKSFTPQEQIFLKNPNPEIPAHLSSVGIINEGKISIPLFESFIKTIQITEDKFIFDEEKNEINKGNVIISNGLTKLEFNLLKFLIQNQGQILERDEIVNAVWGEQKSIAGVTEQALDQLILRLRKKIEENPNSPKLIQTIKGRGLKFEQ